MKTSSRLLLFIAVALVQTFFIVFACYHFQQSDKRRTASLEIAIDDWTEQHLRGQRLDRPWTKERHPFDGYYPNRIPGYRFNDSQTYYGYVMRDLVARMSTHDSSSILVVSPGADSVAHQLHQQNNSQGCVSEQDVGFKVGESILVNTAKQGHKVIGLSPMESNNGSMPDEWWQKSNLQREGAQCHRQILLAVMDSAEKNDEIIQNSVHLLNEAAVNYIVIGVGVNPNEYSFGKKAALILHKLRYKVQILSSSHFPDTTSPWVPNRLLTTPDHFQAYFARLAKYARETQTPVRGYLFATRGLDLAIPSASEYINRVKVDRIEYRQCPQTNASIEFVNTASLDKVHVTCRNVTVSPKDLWFSHSTIANSEAVCARVGCDGKSSTACTTRIVPNDSASNINEQKRSIEETRKAGNSSKPNLLVLMIDPISRARFERSLPKTNRFLQRLNFTAFEKYTAVGNTSASNYDALCSGYLLDESNATQNGGKPREWLWETLKHEGYSTFMASDGCTENSNMIQPFKPYVDHGEALSRMLCFDFQRPNCLGGTSPAEHLVNHTYDFMYLYSALNRPWAAFAHFVDSREDSMVLEGTLDEVLWRALYSMFQLQNDSDQKVWDNTMIVVTSTHGMHYGSYLSSLRGLKERSQPVLYIHSPIGYTSNVEKQSLTRNKEYWTTPFDVYATLMNHLVGKAKSTGHGLSLFTPLPEERKYCTSTTLIPHFVCETLQGVREPGSATMMLNPPSVLSFYSDIPEENKNILEECTTQQIPFSFSRSRMCRCATSHRAWSNCSSYPNMTVSETFSIVKCGNQTSFDIQVKPDPSVMNRREVQDARTTGVNLNRPNILFIEVDSVSFAYADRHFPRTRELLRRHRMQQSGSGFECKNQLCSAEFPYFSVSGPNSIPNQVSAFSGCIVTTGRPERCRPTQKKNGTCTTSVCNDEASPVFGLHLVNVSQNTQTWCPADINEQEERMSPWIFDIARRAGYVTLFAEEFCYDDSPYVAQNNIYQLEADILPHQMFCRLAEAKKPRLPRWLVKLNSPCIGTSHTSKIALDHIRQMWDSYPGTSKFAYLNAMAAHDYSRFPRYVVFFRHYRSCCSKLLLSHKRFHWWTFNLLFRSMTTSSEAYDKVLSSFLDYFINRNDANNTVIVVRSDHGLQGGETTMEYSTQIEAFRPWNELVVPQTLPHVSLDVLARNQVRLVTASDLYRTLAEVMTTGGSQLMPKPPTWTTNILKTSIGTNRTCVDAKVPLTYCLFEDQRTFTAPNIGTCNLATSTTRQDIFCPQVAQYFQSRLANEVDQVLNRTFAAAQINSLICPNKGHGNTQLHVKQWIEIDKLIESFPSPKVSGGIFLYPFQTSLLSSIIGVLGASMYAEEGRNLTVCETGFGSGHSAAMFLEASPHVHVHTFDTFNRSHQLPIVRQLATTFDGRVTHYPGDSCETVPRLLSADNVATSSGKSVRCDLLHGSSLCPRDNIDLVENSPCGVILTSTAMHSLYDDAVYFGDNAQWSQLLKRGCIRDITCFEEKEQLVGRDLLFQRRNGPKPFSHKFCLAITTGKCSKSANNEFDEAECDSQIARFSNLIDLGSICKHSKNRIRMDCGRERTNCNFGGQLPANESFDED